MRKLLFLALLIVGCKPSYVTEIPRDTNLRAGIHLKNPKRVVIFAEDATYLNMHRNTRSIRKLRHASPPYFLLLQRAVSVGLPYTEVSYG